MSWFVGTLCAPTPSDEPGFIEVARYPDYLQKDRTFGVSASSVVIDRDSFNHVRGWSDLAVLEDQDLVIRLSIAGPAVHILSPATVQHRSHPKQTINHIPPFIKTLQRMIGEERAGRYPGGSHRQFERAAVFGGLVFFWARRAFKKGLLAEGLGLLILNLSKVLSALLHRAQVIFRGRQPVERIGFGTQ
jgi:hypothetical protein